MWTILRPKYPQNLNTAWILNVDWKNVGLVTFPGTTTLNNCHGSYTFKLQQAFVFLQDCSRILLPHFLLSWIKSFRVADALPTLWIASESWPCAFTFPSRVYWELRYSQPGRTAAWCSTRCQSHGQGRAGGQRAEGSLTPHCTRPCAHTHPPSPSGKL